MAKGVGLVLSLILWVTPAFSQDQSSAPRLAHHPAPEITRADLAKNFIAIYGLQWATYILTQSETIREHGSYDNWTRYPFEPDFDRDSYDYNLFKHTLVGQYYYQFYRSKGYGVGQASVWAFVSSTAFEFTIETLTEPPSLQDLYQTPVFGTILGIANERLSLYLYNLDVWPARAVAYVLNPFILFPNSHYQMQWSPASFPEEGYGATVSISF